MAKKTKITKKQLREPDEFITVTQRAYQFIAQHLKRIATGAVVVIVLLLAIFFYLKWEEQKEEKADRELNLAAATYQRVASPYGEISQTDYKNVLTKFDEVISKFPRTSAGKLSLLYKGNICLRLGEMEGAIEAYQAFLDKGGKEKLYRSLAMEGLGYAYEGKKDYQKALESYQKVVEMGDGIPLADTYLNMGRCYEKLGKTKEALESYRNFVKVSPKSPMTNTVLRKISSLE